MYVVRYTWPDDNQVQFFGPYETQIRAEGDLLRFLGARHIETRTYVRKHGYVSYKGMTEEGPIQAEIIPLTSRFPWN